METILESKTKTVIISIERPFTVIGERINPTGRKKLAAEMVEGNYDRVVSDAVAQVEAGAAMLDVNAGVPMGNEPEIMAKIVKLVQDTVDVPLSIDSSMVSALQAGLEAYEGKALVNSVTGEEERLEAVLPLIKKYNAAVIGITNDESGISQNPEVRLQVAKKILNRAQDYGIPPEDVLIDPLVMTVGAIPQAGTNVVWLLRHINEDLGVNSVCGASNVSFGLPDRAGLNAAFIAMLISHGLPSAITNPLAPDVHRSILAADVLMGHDEFCGNWIKDYKKRKKSEAEK